MPKQTILAVDDTETNIDVLVDLLSDYNVVVSLDAANALEILKRTHVDLILLDIMMPGMDGFELCEIIKNSADMQEVPLLFITAKGDEESIEKGYKLGAVDYVTKPFKPRELLARVKTHLKMHDLLNHLHERVDEGVAQIQEQEKLLIAQSKSAAMGEMIDAIAHQWTQPLNLINMRVQKLSYDFDDERVDKAYIETLRSKCSSQVHYMLETLTEFRSFLSTDKTLEAFDAQEMVKGCLELLRDELLQHQITVRVSTQDSFTITAVENELKHVLINIINNAKDVFNEKNIKSRKITIGFNDKSITITDNAGGINPLISSSLFKQNVSTKKKVGGSGMGLYMSQKIAQKFAAEILVENMDDGVRFIIKF
ncbi:MAG: response regulator [Sulfurimonadaceae bacterium]